MSVLNQMLTDIERRQGFLPGHVVVSGGITVPANVNRRIVGTSALILIIILIAAGSFWAGRRTDIHIAEPAGSRLQERLNALPLIAQMRRNSSKTNASALANVDQDVHRDSSPIKPTSPGPIASHTAMVTQSRDHSASAPSLATVEAATRANNVQVLQEKRIEQKQIEQKRVVGAIDPKRFTAQQSADNAYQLALESIQNGHKDEAQRQLLALLEANPANAIVRRSLVALLVEQGMRTEAQKQLEEGLRVNPDDDWLAMTLARIQLSAGAPGYAQITLFKAREAGASSAELLAYLAALDQQLGFHAQAVDSFKSALERQPGNGRWQLAMAVSLSALNRVDDATAAARRALLLGSLPPELEGLARRLAGLAKE